ncbi:MAG: hypothetical protein AMXMBFR26_04940 [Porticoccaceae bacterium]
MQERNAMQETDQDRKPAAPQQKPPGFFAIVLSTLAAAIGVQSSKNRERDFAQGSPLPFIAAGIIFTVLFILTVITVVNLVL